MIDRGDYWQCAYVIPKGAADKIRRRGLPSLRDEIATLIPFACDRVGELSDWGDIKLLTGLRRSLASVVSAWAVMHWRCRARHVSDWRCRDQPRRPGCRRGGQHPGFPPPARGCRHRSPSRGSAAAGATDPSHATLAGVSARSRDQPRAEQSAAALAAIASKADAAMAISAPHSRARRRHRISARAPKDLRTFQLTVEAHGAAATGKGGFELGRTSVPVSGSSI